MSQQLQQLIEAEEAVEPLDQQPIPENVEVFHPELVSNLKNEISGNFLRQQKLETYGEEQGVLAIRQLVPGDVAVHPQSRRAFYIYQDGWMDNGRYHQKQIFDMEDDHLFRFSILQLSDVLDQYGQVLSQLNLISSAVHKMKFTKRTHQLPQKQYIEIFEGLVRIGAIIASQKYIGMTDWRITAPESRETLTLYDGQFQGEIPEVFANRPPIEPYLEYSIQLTNRMQMIPFASRCRGLMDDSDWFPGYQCLSQSLGFKPTRIGDMRAVHHDADRHRWIDSIVGTGTYIQSMGLHPSIVQSVMVWIVIICSSAQTVTYRDILQMFLFPNPQATMQEGNDYPGAGFTVPVNFEPPYGVHMLFSIAVRAVMLCGLNAQTHGEILEIPFPTSDHLWGMQSMQAAHTVIKNFSVQFGSMLSMQIANLPFTEMYLTYKRMQARHRPTQIGVFITIRAMIYLQIVGDPTRFVWTQYVFTVFDIPWDITAHHLQQIIDLMLHYEFRHETEKLKRQRVQRQWASSDPTNETNKQIEILKQLARALRRMQWLVHIQVLAQLPEFTELRVVDRQIQQWTMSYTNDLYYTYTYAADKIITHQMSEIGISDFYERQQRYIFLELWRNQRNANRDRNPQELVPADWIPRAKNTRSLVERAQQDPYFVLMQETLPNLTCLQHTLIFLIYAVEYEQDSNMNLIQIQERLLDLTNPLKIIKEPKDGQYIVILRTIHLETRNITRRVFKSKNAEFHYRLITVVIAHMDCFVVSEHDSDDITSRIDVQRRQEIYKPQELKDDSSVLIFYDCETTCGENVSCTPYLISYAIYESIKGIYQQSDRQQNDFPAELLEGEDCFDQFLDFLVHFATKNKKKNIKVIAFNGSRFDHLFLMKSIFEHDLTTDLIVGGTTTNIKFVKMGNLTIQDMQMMVGGGSLNNACRVLLGAGFQKHDCKEILDVHSLEDWNRLDGPIQQKVRLYCCQDVILLFHLYVKLGNYLSEVATQLKEKVTIKPEHSMAASAYKIIMASIEPPKPINNLKIYNAVKSSYFGGHTEIYDLRKHDVWKWDWNSAYPFVMANSIFPMEFDRLAEFPAVKLNNNQDVKEMKIMQCKLYRVTQFRFLENWPMFQVRFKDKIVLPLQYKGELWLWGCSILWAFAVTKLEISYNAVIYSVEQGEPFTFLDSIYQKRLEAREAGNDGLAQVYKLFMNSAYGQMGMKNYPGKMYITDRQLETTEGQHDGWFYDFCKHRRTPLQVKRIRHIDELSSIEITFDEVELPEKAKCRQIYIASLITAKCRALLLSLAYSIRKTLVYCDTDSLMSASPLLPFVPSLRQIFQHIENDNYANYQFSIGNNLGQWKYEDCTNRQPVQGFQAFAKKVYTMQKSVKIKGLRGQEATEATKKLSEIQQGAEVVWKQTQWSRKPGQIRQVPITKSLEFTYNRIVRPDGTTSPLPTAADLNFQSIFRDSNGVYNYK